MFEFLKKRSEKKAQPVSLHSAKDTAKPESKMNIIIESQTPVSAVKQPVTVAPVPTASTGLTIKPVYSAQPTPKGDRENREKAADADASVSNVFTDLFPTNNKTKTDEKLMNSLNASTGTKSILKPNKGDEDLLLYKKPILGANLLKLTVLVILLVSSYFYTQLSPTFDLLSENPMQKRLATYNRVVDIQSKINKQHYILAKYALDDFLYTADSYMHKTASYNSELTPQKKKLELEKEFPTMRAKMRENLLLANERLSYKVMPDNLPAHPEEGGNHEQEFKKALKDSIRDSITSMTTGSEELEFTRTVSKLADNETINPALSKYQIPTMTDTEFAELLALLSESNTSSFGTLNTLRQSRAQWSEIIEEVEHVTAVIDPYFESKFLQDRVGEIFYSSYTLDKSKNALTVIGETFSDDGKNFSLSADLLDAFENSNMFKDVSMDSFSKSKEQSTSYKGVLSIDLTLE